jgi:tetratricopeptide (TPR) repeat protein
MLTDGPTPLAAELAALVTEYRTQGRFAQLREELQRVARQATPDALVIAAEEFREDPQLAAPLYEVVVEAQPNNARAMVLLANAYWLLGAGPEAVAPLAARAMEVDPQNRGAWHLWALAESDPRQRAYRWRQVTERFPGDDLAVANFADNAAAVASAEQDYEMLDLAVHAYEALLARAEHDTQRQALETALQALRGWKF